MKSYSFVLLTLCLVMVSGAKVDLTHIKRLPFGRQLLDIVAIQLSSKNSVDDVLSLLNELEASLENEQAEADQAHEDYQQDCNSTIEGYNEGLADAESYYSDASSNISYYTVQIATTQDQLSELQGTLNDAEETEEQATEERSEEYSDYESNDADYSEAIAACDQATQLVLQLQTSSGSFLQKPVLLELETHVSAVHKVAPSYAALFRTLIQMSTSDKADQTLVAKLLNLIAKLRQAFVDAQEQDAENEEDAEDAYSALVTQLNETEQTLSDTISQLESDLDAYNRGLDAAESTLSDSQDRINGLTGLLNQKTQICSDELASYQTSTSNRNDQLATVEEVIELLQTRVEDVYDSLSD